MPNLARQGGWHPKREQQEYRYLERQKFLRERRAWSIPISISYSGGTPCTVKIIHQAQEVFRHLMIFGYSVRSRLNSLIWSAGVRRNAQTHWRERRGYAQG